MSEQYDALMKTATELLAKFGKKCQITRPTVDSFDPVLGIASGTPLVFDAYAVSMTLKSTTTFEEQDDSNTSTSSTIKAFYIEATSNGLRLGDVLEFGSASFYIAGISSYCPDGTVLVYKAKGIQA